MFSQSKKLDRELLKEISEMIEALASLGTTESLDLAEQFGDRYLELEERIATFDYEKIDRLLETPLI